MARRERGQLTPESAQVHDACLEAAQAAERCATVCAEHGDPEMARCIRLCRDVAELTALTARLMIRGSGSLPKVAQVVHGACLTTADECARFDPDVCQVAEEVLRSCADAVRDVGSGGPVTEDLETVIHDQGGHSPFRHF